MTQNAAWWNDRDKRSVIYQALLILLVGYGVWYLVSNTIDNLQTRNIATGFGFLEREAGFAISESLFEYYPEDSYYKAILVGLFNTFKVAVIGIVLATILGTLIGIARLSSNWLLAKLASVYIEVIRNIPLTLQLLVWYGLMLALPPLDAPLEPISYFYLTQRGLYFPVPEANPIYGVMMGALLVGGAVAALYARQAKKKQEATGKPPRLLVPSLGLILVPPFAAWLIAGAPRVISLPVLDGFNYVGGMFISPEFAALLFGLVVYTAAFIAEIVRAGIMAVPHGQSEAAMSLGLAPGRVLRLVILPQALRVIVPPMTSQYLNLTKNSSLAVVIGFPDLVSVVNTTINQTGQAIEGIAILMMVYLAISLAISLFMNWYNKRIAFKER